MKKVHVLIVLLTISWITSSCERNSRFVSSGVDIITPTGEEKYLNESSEYIFDQKQLHTFEINIPKKALKHIDRNPAAENYVEGNFIFNGEKISPVGIRYKGSIGAFAGSVSGNNWTKPSGRKTATKLSLKVKINWNDSNKTFYGLKKLQFHSQNLDPTQMHERLGYYLFREMGVVAPRSVHARLIINGIYYGVYALTEQIDEQFISHNYNDNSGNLYKEVWPLRIDGSVNLESRFRNNLKTNTNKEVSIDIIRSFANEVVNANDKNLQKIIEKRMNLDEIIAYAVVDRMIRNDDGAFHWYCSQLECFNHNYYWYEEPSTNKVHLIPWDLDNSFQNIMEEDQHVTSIADNWGEISNDCHRFPYGKYGWNQKSAACDKLTAGWASFREEYDEMKLDFINGVFSESHVDSLIDEWSAQIKNSTKKASQLHEDAITVEEWEKAIKELKIKLEYARKNY
jgi:spore coat protein CotH